uniref:Putative secreted protein n=1 Tax=Anopheles marajoara TaxID=58244 RepID=A0A2M4CCQ6_9DIPT
MGTLSFFFFFSFLSYINSTDCPTVWRAARRWLLLWGKLYAGNFRDSSFDQRNFFGSSGGDTCCSLLFCCRFIFFS